MTYSSLLAQSVTWTNTPDTTTDAEGNWTTGSATTTTEPCCLQPFTTAENFAAGTDQTRSRCHLFLLASTTATARSIGVIDGQRYQIDGKPQLWPTPRGPHHCEAVALRIEE